MIDCLLCGKKDQEKLSVANIFSFYSFPEKNCCGDCLKLLEPNEVFETGLNKSTYISLDLYNNKKDRSTCYREVFNNRVILYQDNPIFRDWQDRFQNLGDYELGKVIAEQITLLFAKKEDSLFLPIPDYQMRYEKIGYHPLKSLLDLAHLPYLVFNSELGKIGSELNQFFLVNHTSQMKKDGRTVANRHLILFSMEFKDKDEWQKLVDWCLDNKVKGILLLSLV